jgi:protease IV
MFRRLRAWWRRPALSIDSLSSDVPQDIALRAMLHDLLIDRRAERRSRFGRTLFHFLLVAVPAALYFYFVAYSAGYRFGGPPQGAVGVVHLDGEMSDGSVASAERVLPALRRAFESDRVRAVVLSIDSPGGAPLEAERIYRAIDSWQLSHPKPVVAVINNIGASAGYMVALHCDEIYAGTYSLVGSVGAVLAGWDLHRALERAHVSQRVYASGNLKAMLNPYLPMSPEADAKARDLVTQMGAQFRAELEAQRKGKLATGVDLATGEIWGGAQAKTLELIDDIGTIDEVVKSKWGDARIYDFGPNAPGLPLVGSMAEMVRSAFVMTREDFESRSQAIRG